VSGSSNPPRPTERTFAAPKGTRDFYPADLLRRRYIEKAWRDTSIRHGFDEIEGPTFEHAELYTVKSGEGILSEMFNVFSGKDEEEVRLVRESGRAPLALRPEFTPTLARMYAARAAQLPRPTKWSWQQNCYRAEKPQRGRLREFGQWNVDLMGDGSAAADAEVFACCVGLLDWLGLRPADARCRYNHREVLTELVTRLGVDDEHIGAAFVLLDRRDRLDNDDLEAMAFEFGLTDGDFIAFLKRPRGRTDLKELLEWAPDGSAKANKDLAATLRGLEDDLASAGVADWCTLDFNVVRGLAYYTGAVFEVFEEGEGKRAIAGGGRYDNLIELFGGPPTPAVGFGMGDVVLGNLLEDRKLMPEGPALLEAISAPSASLRPDVLVIANEKEESQKALRPLVARLRRGTESQAWADRADRKAWGRDRFEVPPLHARRSYKATKNIGKLLQDAGAQHARFAAIIENAESCTLKNLDTREEQKNVPLSELGARVSAR
jgi:histidyl-tRNA synthetase